MTRARAIVAATASLATLAGLVAARAPATSADPAPGPKTGLALVTLDTPEIKAAPVGEPSQRRLERLARSNQLIDAVAEAHGLELVGTIPELGTIVVDPADSVAEVRDELSGDPRVESVTPDRRLELRLTPNDPTFRMRDPNAPNGDRAQWHLIRERFPGAWGLSNGAKAKVAVIDTGADVANHPDLAGASRLDCSGSSCQGTDVTDLNGHGTHTAGLACANSNNHYALASAGFNCRLFVIKTDLTYASIEASLMAAADHHSDVISMSFGGGDSSLNGALGYAYASGAVLVAAGANDPTPSASGNYPAQYVQRQGSGPNINAGKGLVVTAAKYSGGRADFAQKDSGVSVAAFGSVFGQGSGGQSGILSTWPLAAVEEDTGYVDPFDPLNPVPPCGCRTTPPGVGGSDDKFAYLEGTSMATPQVAGLAGLIRSVRPKMPNDKVARLIKLTADGHGEYGRGLGWGVIDAYAAVGAALQKDITAPVSRVRSARRVRGSRASASGRGRRLVTLRLKHFDPQPRPLVKSGVRSVMVFVSVDGRRFHRLGKTRRRHLRVRLRAGHRYRFYSRAVDRAGNREGAPANPDASLRLR